jgi:hypothetical protein
VFTPADHPLVGTESTYLPTGSSPYALIYAPTEGHVIMRSGDPVTVLSAWSRDYLPDAPTLLYVQSHNTKECTHVTESDLVSLTNR